MSYCEHFVPKEIVPGVTCFDLDWSEVGAIGLPRLKPKLMIFERDQAPWQGLAKNDVPQRGVYILFDSQKTNTHRYNVRVGLSGVSGKKQTLFDRLKDHANRPPKQMRGWDKAIAICDWENDIPVEIIAEKKADEDRIRQQLKNRNAIINSMCEEAKFLEKKLYEAISTIPALILRGHSHNNGVILNADKVRYNLYILYVLRLLDCEIGFVKESAANRIGRRSSGIENLMAEGKLTINEKLYGKFESKATVINIDGTLCVEKYKRNGKPVTNSTNPGLKVISANEASDIILEENGQAKSMSSMRFWMVKRYNDTIKLSNF